MDGPGPLAVLTEHAQGRGWGPVQVVPRSEASADVASGAVQYGLAVFEGLTAQRARDRGIRLFRARAHAQRMRNSAARLGLPSVSEPLFLALATRAIQCQARLVPAHGQGALHMRSTLLAVDPVVLDMPGPDSRPADRHRLVFVVAPAPAPGEIEWRLWVEQDLVRTVPGALTRANSAANHAAGLIGRERARRHGYDDALWLDPRWRRDVTEAGATNIFLVLGDMVVTPADDGSIVAGVTRECCLTLLREWGVPVEERPVAFDELVAAGTSGQLREVFAAGADTNVVTIAEIGHVGGVVRPAGGPLAARLRCALNDIQEGSAPDRWSWVEFVACDEFVTV